LSVNVPSAGTLYVIIIEEPMDRSRIKLAPLLSGGGQVFYPAFFNPGIQQYEKTRLCIARVL
jgi:hypothetical protein